MKKRLNIVILGVFISITWQTHIFSNAVFKYTPPNTTMTNKGPKWKRWLLKNQSALNVLETLDALLPNHGCQVGRQTYRLYCKTPDELQDKLRRFIYWLDQHEDQYLICVYVYEVVFDQQKNSDLGLSQLSQGLRYNLLNPIENLSNQEAILELVNRKGQATLLASPTLVVARNQTATIQVGDRLPFIQETLVAQAVVRQVQFVDTGLSLTVKPVPIGDTHVQLDLQAEVASVKLWKTFKSGQFPVISTRKTSSLVVVPFNHQLVLAGLLDQQESENTQGIPFLSQLPLLGHVFKRTQKHKMNSDIVFIIAPFKHSKTLSKSKK